MLLCLGGSGLFKAIKDQFFFFFAYFGCLRDFIRPNLAEGKVGRLFGQNLSKSFKAWGFVTFRLSLFCVIFSLRDKAFTLIIKLI